jgi:hypothetical protein
MSGSMTVLVTLGNTIGASVALPYINETRSLGWMVSMPALPYFYISHLTL